jgi:hypothetical protein
MFFQYIVNWYVFEFLIFLSRIEFFDLCGNIILGCRNGRSYIEIVKEEDIDVFRFIKAIKR